MTDLANLEKRVKILESIEAIRKLKFKYWWTMDTKDWAGFSECFTEDLEYELWGGSAKGRDNLVAEAEGLLNDDRMVTAHHGHQYDISISSDTTAEGIWALRDAVTDKMSGAEFNGRGYYEEQYRKEDGVWRIAKMRIWYSSTTGAAKQYGLEGAQFMAFLAGTRDN